MIQLENFKFDSKEELKQMSINRLFVLQKLQLSDLCYKLENQGIYDKNDLFNTIQIIDIVNLVITKKINEKNYR